jgi:Zn-dependent protease
MGEVRRLFSRAVLIVGLVCFLLSVSSFANGAGVKIQLCLIIDGSASINAPQWKIITQAISEAIKVTIPHDGSVELSIVQFGYTAVEGYAKVELQPTIIDGTNHAAIEAQVSEIPKGGGNTPTAHGLYLGWSLLRNSPSFSSNAKQVINLATDGVPNVRNSNATIDLDESGGSANAKDDVVATVNSAVTQGLDELDVEGIGMSKNDLNWLGNWTVHPQPGIVAPPFTKTGWIRVVADPAEFASTVGQKMQVIISGNSDVWVPPAEGVLLSGLLTVGATSLISYLGQALSEPASELAQKINGLFPEILKKWLHDFVSSKRKLVIAEKRGNPFKLTKLEVASYTVALSILTFAFVYAKVQTLDDVLVVLPTILVTSIIVEFVKNFTVETVARKLGVWTEHRLWYFGVAAFLLSTLAFRTPFASPSRNIHYSKSFTKRSLGLVSATSVFIGFAFAVIFGVIFVSGFTLIGSIGMVMALTIAFFEALPIPPMSGKDIYDWSHSLWAGLFAATSVMYILCLLIL